MGTELKVGIASGLTIQKICLEYINFYQRRSQVNLESPIKASTGAIICGIIAIIVISFMTVFPNQTVSEDIKLVLKEQRPYKLEVHHIRSLDNYPLFRQSERERSFSPIIFAAANRHSVDPALVKAVIMVESSYDPMAISKKGAIGLMQLMPNTAAALGVEDSLNPEHNINGGVKYLKQLLNQFQGDLQLALAAYNAGSRKVKKYKGIPPYKATQNFVEKVFQYYQHYKKEI